MVEAPGANVPGLCEDAERMLREALANEESGIRELLERCGSPCGVSLSGCARVLRKLPDRTRTSAGATRRSVSTLVRRSAVQESIVFRTPGRNLP